MAESLANNTAKAMADAINTALNAGAGAARIKIYSGTVPTDADTALGAQVLLVDLPCTDPFAPAATDAAPGGRLTANAITTTNAGANGTASFFRMTESAGAVVLQGSVGTSGEDMNFSTVVFVSGTPIVISSLTITQPEA